MTLDIRQLQPFGRAVKLSSPTLTTAEAEELQAAFRADGLLVVRKIENVATGPNNQPTLQLTIAECGEM